MIHGGYRKLACTHNQYSRTPRHLDALGRRTWALLTRPPFVIMFTALSGTDTEAGEDSRFVLASRRSDFKWPPSRLPLVEVPTSHIPSDVSSAITSQGT